MSTQFETSIVDLDRTDELPVLDVDAYEASLAANDKNLSRTDTWAVEGLRSVEEVDEVDEEPACVLPLLPVAKPPVQTESLTSNVERILKRITELEAQIVASHETNARLQKHCEALETEQAQEALRIEALQADNARLGLDRAQSDEVTKRLEQQPRARADSIATLEKSLIDEQDLSAHLSQQLAAKLMEGEKTHAIIGQRDHTIEDLIREGADLKQRLQLESAAGADLTTRLAVAEQSLRDSDSLLLDRDQVIEKKNAELTLLRSELVSAQAEAQSQTQLLSERTDQLGTLQRVVNEHETAIGKFELAIRLSGEQSEDLMTQLRTAREERAKVGLLLEKARAREKNLTDQIFSRDNQIASLQADLAVHMEALATIRRDVNRIGDQSDGEFEELEHTLEPVEHDGPTLYLTREVLTVGRTSDNDISIPSKLVSRNHARLLVGPTGVIIEDVNSTNGCYVNGEKIRQHLLHDGDMLELGDLRYCLRTRAVRERKDTKLRQLRLPSRKTGPRTVN